MPFRNRSRSAVAASAAVLLGALAALIGAVVANGDLQDLFIVLAWVLGPVAAVCLAAMWLLQVKGRELL
jgi:hypothetical protein